MPVDNWLNPNLSSIETLCQCYPKRIRKLFRFLNLEQPGLEMVKASVAQQNWVSACIALVEYYQTQSGLSHLKSLGSRYQIASNLPLEQILSDTFTFQQQIGTVPRSEDGLLNWAWEPNDDPEWTWFLNRHYHLLNLLHAYQQTGNSLYTTCINRHLLDWILSSFSKPNQWRFQWRSRESALRVLHWTSLFHGLTSSLELSPVVRILMLSSLLDHACYLRHLHHWGANWLCREMSGLATISLCWPEFKLADAWFNYARDRLLQELTRQVYPDGVHKELTSYYHRVVFHDIQNFVELSELTQKPLPTLFRQVLEQMLSYLVYSMTPTGQSVLNNDSDEEDNRALIERSAGFYERPDWLHFADHSAGVAEKLKEGYSRAFPWAGQVISRSGWDEQAQWSFFDIGSAGINYHIHYDKLHLSIASGGRQLLVDGGRYRYRKDRFWHYFRSSASHNVILIDGQGQGVDYREQTYPLTDHYTLTPTVDFAWGCFNGPFPGLKGKASHARAVVYLHNKYWVVVDHIESDRPRTLQPLWHFHPHCTVVLEGERASSIDPDVGNLQIIPVASFPWQVTLVAGQDHPVQGWWSREYNHCVPNPTAIYSTEATTLVTFAWVLYPAIGEVPAVKVELLPAPLGSMRIAVTVPGQPTDEIAICMAGNQPIPLSGDLLLRGNCAVLSVGQSPIVAQGSIWQNNQEIFSDEICLDASNMPLARS
ncbi:MAG: heparinase II/III family protein [Scytolyngbya sp. HA4215-MV1]|nr:heparinase II/III family protein [Scytolyngbya sp. HA4215-MV1]